MCSVAHSPGNKSAAQTATTLSLTTDNDNILHMHTMQTIIERAQFGRGYDQPMIISSYNLC